MTRPGTVSHRAVAACTDTVAADVAPAALAPEDSIVIVVDVDATSQVGRTSLAPPTPLAGASCTSSSLRKNRGDLLGSGGAEAPTNATLTRDMHFAARDR